VAKNGQKRVTLASISETSVRVGLATSPTTYKSNFNEGSDFT